VRDWLHVEDHCEAIRRVLQAGHPGETYNVGGNNQPTNLEVVQVLCTLLDARRPGAPHADLIRRVADRPGHDRRYAMDITKIRTELGWQPRHDLKTGLAATVDWYLGHPDWVAAIRSRGVYRDWLDSNYEHRGEAQ
jgi:dTDP-glucose 4,6-dehydratase